MNYFLFPLGSRYGFADLCLRAFEVGHDGATLSPSSAGEISRSTCSRASEPQQYLLTQKVLDESLILGILLA